MVDTAHLEREVGRAGGASVMEHSDILRAAETIEQRLGGGRIMEPSRAPRRSKGAGR